MRRLKFGVMAVVAIAVMLGAGATADAQKRGGTLRVAYGNEIAGLNFHTVPGYEMVWVATNVGCGLISITPDGKFIPDAAESWQISPDGLLYTRRSRESPQAPRTSRAERDAERPDGSGRRASLPKLKPCCGFLFS
jgi:ABC-type transport system substrate-binding protein